MLCYTDPPEGSPGGLRANSPFGMDRQGPSKTLPGEIEMMLLFYLSQPLKGVSVREQEINICEYQNSL